MNHCNLQSLIDALEYGTNLHIGVIFFGNYGNEKLKVSYDNTIHPCKVCSEFKKTSKGLKKCFKCRNLAIQKAIKEKKSFGGICINGVYEYTHTIVENEDVICIIFIGNIIPDDDNSQKLIYKLGNNKELLGTMEKDFDYKKCKTFGLLIESYIRLLLKDTEIIKNKSSYNALIENIKTFIDTNIENDIPIIKIADIFHYNEKYLGRLFKSETGITYNEYINTQRLNKAKFLLETKSDSIINISILSGFNNVTYFNRLFKRPFKITPSEYRKGTHLT